MNRELSTHFGRLKLTNPLIVGACPMTGDERMRGELEQAGAAAVVLPSLFQEQVVSWNERHGLDLTDSDRQILKRSKRSGVEAFCDDADTYLSIVNRACSISSIPIIASLNGESEGNWLDFAGELQEAGAAAIELSIHASSPQAFTSPQFMEDSVTNLVSTIGKSITVPVFVKLERNFTSLSHLCQRLLSGADGLVLFGRSPMLDISLDTLQFQSRWHLTEPHSVSSTLSSILGVHSYCPAMPLAACGGISSAEDVLKAILSGADVAMITSAIYRDGCAVIPKILKGIQAFFDARHWNGLNDLYNARPIEFGSETDRAHYIRALASRNNPGPDHASTSIATGDRWGHLQQ